MTFQGLIEYISSSGDADIRIDSRNVSTGDIFVAIEGASADGHNYITQALESGASYIVCQNQCNPPADKIVTVENSAKALAILSQAKHGNPSQKLINLAVTGTNGKTTVCFLTRSIIEAAGKNCGLIGTILYDTGSQKQDAPLTTPNALDIARLSRQMVDSGADFLAIEASSHALSQNRLASLDFKAAAFTNLTGDHLDYHKTKENYLAAKTLLFQQLSSASTAVLNSQSPESKYISDQTDASVLWYAIDQPADITAEIKSIAIGKTVYDLKYKGRTQKVTTSLIGRHNISNHLAAAGLALSAGISLETVAQGLADLKAVPGRLETVIAGQPFAVLVDYAHTDDALNNVMTTLKPLCKGKLIVLFGCGGDRDKTKRPRMAKQAQAIADSIIVTSDNPRTENPDSIIDDIMTGFTNPDSANIAIQPDRKLAIVHAVNSASKDDIVLIAGKGHETYQIIGDKKYDFDDRQIASDALEKLT